MVVIVECRGCGAEIGVDVCGAIRAIVEAAERKSIFGGFLCAECGETADAGK